MIKIGDRLIGIAVEVEGMRMTAVSEVFDYRTGSGVIAPAVYVKFDEPFPELAYNRPDGTGETLVLAKYVKPQDIELGSKVRHVDLDIMGIVVGSYVSVLGSKGWSVDVPYSNAPSSRENDERRFTVIGISEEKLSLVD